jgi:hypothetical protein
MICRARFSNLTLPPKKAVRVPEKYVKEQMKPSKRNLTTATHQKAQGKITLGKARRTPVIEIKEPAHALLSPGMPNGFEFVQYREYACNKIPSSPSRSPLQPSLNQHMS